MLSVVEDGLSLTIDTGKKGIGNGSTLVVQSVFPRGLIEAVFYTKNRCKTTTSIVVSVRESSVVRGAVLMVIEDLWMQVRVNLQKLK